ncbi:MAG: DUF1841 family protein [Deltaproteobacteria bacterium]|nr:DUF1841 family protein [Deltaproteobacteria bacterium]
MSELSLEVLRQWNREKFHYIWQNAKRQESDGLTAEEQKLAEIMLAHSEEYFNQFELADLLGDHEFNPGGEVDPFLHVTFHAIVENQIEGRDPIEAVQFYNAMRKKDCSRREAIHLLMAIFIYVFLPVLKEKRPFRLDTYCKLLKDYKLRKPEKIYDLLENEPDLIAGEEPNAKG